MTTHTSAVRSREPVNKLSLRARKAHLGTAPGTLDLILKEETNLVVWRRSALPWEAFSYAEWLATGDFETQLDERGCPDLELPPAPGRQELLADWAWALARFGELCAGAHVDAKVSVVTTNKCTLFHADYNRVRWLCTYAGPGTQWIAHDDLCAAGSLLTTKRIQRGDFDQSSVRQAQRGDVVLLKGNNYRGNDGFGAIHRSPPIEGTNLRRLLLTLTWH